MRSMTSERRCSLEAKQLEDDLAVTFRTPRRELSGVYAFNRYRTFPRAESRTVETSVNRSEEETHMRRTALLILCAALMIAVSTGCMNQEKNDQLSEVAKGWCRTIRASQVIPVYPLTEDVQVGDLFIMQRP